MSFRRSLVLALVVSTAIGVYAVTHHTSAPTDSTSAYILITPTVLETSVPTTVATTIIPAPTKVSFVRSVVLTPSPSVTASASSYSAASASDVIDLKKLRSKDVAIEVHKVSSGENYWTLAKKANIDIYTLIGANPTMPFKAAYHMTLNILSQKGILHTVHSDDTLLKLAEKYRTTEKSNSRRESTFIGGIPFKREMCFSFPMSGLC